MVLVVLKLSKSKTVAVTFIFHPLSAKKCIVLYF